MIAVSLVFSLLVSNVTPHLIRCPCVAALRTLAARGCGLSSHLGLPGGLHLLLLRALRLQLLVPSAFKRADWGDQCMLAGIGKALEKRPRSAASLLATLKSHLLITPPSFCLHFLSLAANKGRGLISGE